MVGTLPDAGNLIVFGKTNQDKQIGWQHRANQDNRHDTEYWFYRNN